MHYFLESVAALELINTGSLSHDSFSALTCNESKTSEPLSLLTSILLQDELIFVMMENGAAEGMEESEVDVQRSSSKVQQQAGSNRPNWSNGIS